ncbi:MAG: hypothetical protein LBK72_10160 [Bifidobacteriaceae bacterium]|nr:hypothetical protein [Bifidobacteriaceae bacterium]
MTYPRHLSLRVFGVQHTLQFREIRRPWSDGVGGKCRNIVRWRHVSQPGNDSQACTSVAIASLTPSVLTPRRSDKADRRVVEASGAGAGIVRRGRAGQPEVASHPGQGDPAAGGSVELGGAMAHPGHNDGDPPRLGEVADDSDAQPWIGTRAEDGAGCRREVVVRCGLCGRSGLDGIGTPRSQRGQGPSKGENGEHPSVGELGKAMLP